jgi:hypothetical protein
MKDIDFPPDEGFPDILPDDRDEQMEYFRRFRGRYPKETGELYPDELLNKVREALALCPPLRIRAPRDVLRFLAIRILHYPTLTKSTFLTNIVERVLNVVEDWSATKRLDFIEQHVLGRSLPDIEPDFGPWFQLFGGVTGQTKGKGGPENGMT